MIVPATLLAGPATADEVLTFEDHVPSFDGHLVPIKVYLPDGGTATSPTLLWGHGWAGSYGDSTGDGEFFASEGYNVVAMDFRGFGKARQTSEARVHSVEYEIKDVLAVIDWIEGQTWAATDTTGDPILGALGGSYGGGYQLLTAAVDDRLDAIAPEITWHDLTQSLEPSGNTKYGAPYHDIGVVKSAWVQLLYWGGNAAGSLHDTIHEAYASAMVLNEVTSDSLLGAELVNSLRMSSPKSYDTAIDIPTFLIQGMPDTLFNYNEAFANYEMIKATGAEVKLATHLGGHIINTDGTIPGDSPIPFGLQPGGGGAPCATDNTAILAWYDKHLKGLAVNTGPELEMALDDGTCVTSDDLPKLLDPRWLQRYGGEPILIHPNGVPDGVHAELGVTRVDEAWWLASFTAPWDMVVAGIPTLEGRIEVYGPEAILFFALTRDDGTSRTVVNSQYTPLRVGSGVTDFKIDLGGIATPLAQGETLHLEMYQWVEQYGTNHGRTPSAYQIGPYVLDLPTVKVG